ncbi:hypothetical protein HPP92_001451 [Vanilla planifolia]|uniref:Uncharacterized protein n=1 Tax=Vanilla planifolia TaxID=51239 RepID=A0A835RZU3_VANPL|nr:hypothetical protein HPP92_001741 [Vanilla planifolia]KAG0501379.1 hypothetical protein HPP92_001451 [Vanilla planifolia]
MGRSPCCEKAHTNKGAWTKEEDERLVAYIRAHGEGCWRSLPKAAGLLRCGKSCRLRWINYLRPDLKRGNFTEEDDDIIIKLHSVLGNKWSLIAGKLPGRTDNEIKNYWNTHIRRKLLSRGIDPVTHCPLRPSPTDCTESLDKRSAKEQRENNINNNNDSSRSSNEDERRQWRCPDLNLELCLSMPFEQQPEAEKEGLGGCFSCRLGVKRGSDCCFSSPEQHSVHL